VGDFISLELLGFIALGFFAQLVDGALGMAYGLIGTSVLLAIGLPPAVASASVHSAEIVTTGLAGASHVWHKNIDWPLLKKLAPVGVAGGIAGAFIAVVLPEAVVKVFIAVYLLAITVFIMRRIRSKKATVGTKAQRERKLPTVPVGAAGGMLDAIGGGGWGALVTSTLLARGDHPRRTIGSVTLSEFFLTLATSAAFFAALDFLDYWMVVVGLIVGGAVAAPFAGYISKVLQPRTLMIMVAAVIGVLSAYNLGSAALSIAEAMGH
jgi:uncharacterized membrane protein YfcA